ncbi:MAG TPA: molybdopterin-dependent oxidoreductase, partial [Blastocatellia bacterium]|nr:molybdopterin-dependent oxidoreductase [Blastocatellia bacterium]
MTNGWVDIKNTDMMLIMGGNPAENHPCGFKWPIEAKRTRNAKMIVIDPRFTRTAATADLFLQIRAGADIAFLGGLINYTLANDRFAKDYLINYTNAAFIVKDGFKLPEDGLYSGFNASTQVYDKSTWNYEEGGNMTGQGAPAAPAAASAAVVDGAASHPMFEPVSYQAAVAQSPGAAQAQKPGEAPKPAGAAAPAAATPAAPPPPASL